MTQTPDKSQLESPGFVSIQSIELDQSSLKELMKRCFSSDTWYCLRWPHGTKFESGLPNDDDFPCVEGQVFDQKRELRWKSKGKQYEALLLSTTPVTDSALQPLDKTLKWFIRDLNANF